MTKAHGHNADTFLTELLRSTRSTYNAYLHVRSNGQESRPACEDQTEVLATPRHEPHGCPTQPESIIVRDDSVIPRGRTPHVSPSTPAPAGLPTRRARPFSRVIDAAYARRTRPSYI